MIRLDKVTKKFGTGAFALSDISLKVEKGEFVFLIGPTGSGKTTIFRLLIRDLLPTGGNIFVSDFDIVKLPHGKIPILRKKVGVVFQDLKLLTDRTIFENIILSCEIANIPKKEAIEKTHEALKRVGIIEHKEKFPVQLSGGELQRAAIARALVLSPEVVLADEPTGNLDLATSWEIVNLLSEINKKGTTIVMATHNTEIVNKMPLRIVGLDKGRIVRDEKKEEKKEDKNKK
ncbi:MAG: cell division ATP-binding protein FtsE [Candidatus Levybacteria bacterium RIFCSPHIGHO2_01_FULL_38_26]|nr:MAG: cell division ATP-binding protein FtsE [Candidatus Levybacteria bacterium RIFCSPHIGHO2_01_FULL_38_26]